MGAVFDELSGSFPANSLEGVTTTANASSPMNPNHSVTSSLADKQSTRDNATLENMVILPPLLVL